MLTPLEGFSILLILGLIGIFIILISGSKETAKSRPNLYEIDVKKYERYQSLVKAKYKKNKNNNSKGYYKKSSQKAA